MDDAPTCDQSDDMYQMAGVTFPAVARLYLFHNVLNDARLSTFEKFLPAIIEGYDKVQEQIKRLKTRSMKDYGPRGISSRRLQHS